MTRRTVFAAMLAVVLALGAGSVRADDTAAIQETNARWLALVAAKDAAGIAALYAEDGAIMPSGQPAAQGRAAIAAAWSGLFALPGFSLTFATTTLQIATSGDIAYDIGTYALGFDGESGRIEDKGKYVVAWKKVDGVSLVAADIFNSDGPPAP
jgi:uncharacterized protein (TIGR02246 family)